MYPKIGRVADLVQCKLTEAAPVYTVSRVGDRSMTGIPICEYILAIAENRTSGERRKFCLVVPFGKGTRVVPEE